MQTKPKANSIITTRLDDNRNPVLTFRDGETIVGELTIDRSRMSETALEEATIYGLIQWASDKAALGRDKATGASASVADKFARVSKYVEWANGGGVTLNPPRSATGPSLDGGLIVQAMIRCGIGADVDAVNALLARYATKKGVDRTGALQAFARTEEVIQAMAAIRAERSKVSAASLLEEMDDEPETPNADADVGPALM